MLLHTGVRHFCSEKTEVGSFNAKYQTNKRSVVMFICKTQSAIKKTNRTCTDAYCRC